MNEKQKNLIASKSQRKTMKAGLLASGTFGAANALAAQRSSSEATSSSGMTPFQISM